MCIFLKFFDKFGPQNWPEDQSLRLWFVQVKKLQTVFSFSSSLSHKLARSPTMFYSTLLIKIQPRIINHYYVCLKVILYMVIVNQLRCFALINCQYNDFSKSAITNKISHSTKAINKKL